MRRLAYYRGSFYFYSIPFFFRGVPPRNTQLREFVTFRRYSTTIVDGFDNTIDFRMHPSPWSRFSLPLVLLFSLGSTAKHNSLHIQVGTAIYSTPGTFGVEKPGQLFGTRRGPVHIPTAFIGLSRHKKKRLYNFIKIVPFFLLFLDEFAHLVRVPAVKKGSYLTCLSRSGQPHSLGIRGSHRSVHDCPSFLIWISVDFTCLIMLADGTNEILVNSASPCPTFFIPARS